MVQLKPQPEEFEGAAFFVSWNQVGPALGENGVEAKIKKCGSTSVKIVFLFLFSATEHGGASGLFLFGSFNFLIG